MPDLSKYDLDFRPKNYWDLRDVLTFVEAKITGKERKEIIKKEIQEGRRVPEELLKGSLDKNLRKLLGSMHPSFMGGEYLPKLEDADVIIASINLESTTSDVIVVIARLTDRGIEYRVEDEYLDSYPEGREHFKVQPKFSKEPLSFKELIDLIDNAEENGGLVESAKNCNYEAEIGYELEDVYDFGTAKSAFYPQLEDWYDEVNEEWLKKKKEELRQVKIEDEKVVPAKELEQDEKITDTSDDYPKGDFKTAYNAFLQLAEQGVASAQYNLGCMYAGGQGVLQDYKEAFKWYRLAAEQGHATAQYNLGTMYDEGTGVPQDDKESAKWWKLSAEQEFAEAQFSLGNIYEDGQDVPQDFVLSHMWFNLAGSNELKIAVASRKILETKMTPSQIEKAQEMARNWKPKTK